MPTTTLTADQRVVPVVRRLAAKLGVNPHALTGTGGDGRVLRGDVQAAALAARRADIGTARVTPRVNASGPTTPPAANPFPGTSHMPTTVAGPAGSGTAAANLRPNSGGLPEYDPGPLAADAWFPQVTAADKQHHERHAHRCPASASTPAPTYTDGWFPGVSVPTLAG
jgi:pyruvate/2-oxoglutarate dehydrogenase complex dihydrolipoamide acyltransferase (E2) component